MSTPKPCIKRDADDCSPNKSAHVDAVLLRMGKASAQIAALCTVVNGDWNMVHIKPLRDGGARPDPSNVQPLCSRCYAQKTGRQGV